MTYLQFLLVIHVLGAIVGFGSTFAFAFFPQEGDAPRAACSNDARGRQLQDHDEVLGPGRVLHRSPSPGP